MSSLEDYMLPCLNKKLFGIDCLGCGLQRAIVLVFQGEFSAAFKMYPAVFTILLLAFFIIFNLFYKFKHDSKIKIFLLILNAAIIVASYLYKITN